MIRDFNARNLSNWLHRLLLARLHFAARLVYRMGKIDSRFDITEEFGTEHAAESSKQGALDLNGQHQVEDDASSDASNEDETDERW